MDVSLFYKDLFERAMGLDTLGLESEFRELVKVVETRTIPAFSLMVPATYRTYLDLRNENAVVSKPYYTYGVEYTLDDPVLDRFNLEIYGIGDIEISNNGGPIDPYDPNSSAYYSSLISSRNNITLESVLQGSEYTYNRTLIDTALPWKRYAEYRGGRVIYLKNWFIQAMLEIPLYVKWPNLASIPPEYKENLMGLAKLDVKSFLWNQLKYIESVQLPNGNMDLKINDWESAERDRDDYLKELRSKTMPDRTGSSYFHIL